MSKYNKEFWKELKEAEEIEKRKTIEMFEEIKAARRNK